MAKLTLSTVTNIATPSGVQTVNNNFDAIEAAFEKTLSRDGTTPNQMTADLDLNNNDLLNAGSISTNILLVDGINLNEQVSQAALSAAAAALSAIDAEDSAQEAADILSQITEGIIPDGSVTDAKVAPGINSNKSSYLSNGTGAVSRTVYSKLRDFVNAADYGALGDDTSDDGPAIQRAIDAANSGDVILLPKNGVIRVATTINVGKTVHIWGGGTTEGTKMRVDGAIRAFSVTAAGARISGFRIYGDRTTNQAAIYYTAPYVTIDDMDIQLVDYGIHMNGGNHSRLSHIRMRNIKTVVIWLQDGVGPRLHDCFYDTDGSWYSADPSYAQPSRGVWLQCEGVQMSDCDFIHAGIGLHIETSETRHIEWCIFVNSFFDSCIGNPGIRITNNTANRCRGLFFTGMWSATGSMGMLVDGTTDINGVYWTGGSLHNNTNEGVRITNPQAFNVLFKSAALIGNNSGATGANNVYTNTTGRVAFLDCEFGRQANWASIVLNHVHTGPNQSAEVDCTGSYFDTGGASAGAFSKNGTGGIRIINVTGVVRKQKGTATIASGTTSIVVTTALQVPFADQSAMVWPLTGWGSAAQWWTDNVGSPTAGEFTIVVNTNPGLNMQFGWMVEVDVL